MFAIIVFFNTVFGRLGRRDTYIVQTLVPEVVHLTDDVLAELGLGKGTSILAAPLKVEGLVLDGGSVLLEREHRLSRLNVHLCLGLVDDDVSRASKQQ